MVWSTMSRASFLATLWMEDYNLKFNKKGYAVVQVIRQFNLMWFNTTDSYKNMTNISELKTKGLKAASWNFFNMMVNQLRNFIVSLVLARLLTPADFGLVSMAMVLNSILDFLVDFGFSSAVIRRKEVNSVELSTIFWINIIVGAACSLLVFGCAPVFAWFYEMPYLKNIVYITSLSFIISSFGTLQTALFQRELNFRKPFVAKLISGVMSGIVGITMAFLGCGVWSLVVSNLCGWLLYSSIIWTMSKWRPQFTFHFRAVKDMVSFGWKMTGATFINRIVRQLDTFIIGKVFSATSLGLFNRAQSLNHLVIDYSFSSVRGVMLPTLSKLQDDLEAMRYSVLKLINVISFLTFLMSGLMYICAPDIILLLYGKQWEGSIEIFKILGLFSISLCLPIVFDTVLTAVNRMTMYLWISIIANVITLIAIPIGIRYGLSGYIWAVSIASVLKLLPRIVAANICIGLPYKSQFSSILRYGLPFIILLVIWNYVNFSTKYFVVNIIIKSFVYTALYLLINIVIKNDGLKICWSMLKQYLRKRMYSQQDKSF